MLRSLASLTVVAPFAPPCATPSTSPPLGLQVASGLLGSAVSHGATRQVAAAIAAALWRLVMAADTTDDYDDVRSRAEVIVAPLQAHSAANDIAGAPSHNLGCSGHQLSTDERRVLRNLRRKANSAKHKWPTMKPAVSNHAAPASPRSSTPSSHETATEE